MTARLLALLKQLPITAYLVIAGFAAAGGWLALNNAHQRQLGALAVQLKTVRAAADSATAVLTRRNLELDGMVAAADLKAARNQAAKHASDVQAAHLKTARDSLAQAVADSLATLEQLRARAARMIAASDAAELAHAVERLTADSALKASRRALTFAVDSVRAAGKTALDAMRTRAETAERAGVGRAKGWRAALLGRCGVIVGVGGVRSGNQVYAGPAVTLGCRAFP